MDLQMEGKNPFLDLYSGDTARPESRRLLQVSTGGCGRGKRNVGAADGPSTPGRPVFSFSVGNFSRKSIPSKWDDAEKWVVNDYPAAHHHHHQFLQGPSHGVPLATSADLILKDKWISEMECIRRSPTRQGFVFGGHNNAAKDVAILEGINGIGHRETGTEMTPMASSTTSRCHTPAKTSSPVHHNTPTATSGPLDPPSLALDISQLPQHCGFSAKLQVGSLSSNHWSSREEEEEEVSKSLRHFEITSNNECGPAKKTGPWEEEAKATNRLRYERELANIQAWVNLQSAKTEAQSKKFEVKIQKMRSNMEEKLLKRMSNVHRKAEEWRAAAQLQHEEEMKKDGVGRGGQEKMINRKPFVNVYPTNSSSCSCFCFPFNNHLM
ncbi:unnamed protein product [Cuscuta campestris]|uniref:Remorin C-terminal domain-containing protein n=1 Tax=Cuscuta campestris TaxID=132261 RepID=A0A484NJX6_9ASTE|nr:unnamed protein product [Cuscuta campestris]